MLLYRHYLSDVYYWFQAYEIKYTNGFTNIFFSYMLVVFSCTYLLTCADIKKGYIVLKELNMKDRTYIYSGILIPVVFPCVLCE